MPSKAFDPSYVVPLPTFPHTNAREYSSPRLPSTSPPLQHRTLSPHPPPALSSPGSLLLPRDTPAHALPVLAGLNRRVDGHCWTREEWWCMS